MKQTYVFSDGLIATNSRDEAIKLINEGKEILVVPQMFGSSYGVYILSDQKRDGAHILKDYERQAMCHCLGSAVSESRAKEIQS